MAQGVVFKQWYKSINLPGIAARNQKHLNYIATRKGCIPNPGCNFGLWGRLPNRALNNIDSLEQAKAVVGAASSRHTIYRAIFSVDKDTAQNYDLYNRATWETLVNERIKTLAKEMGIESKDFCWVASMHHKKSHPHVHILYWDNGNSVRTEYVPDERFEVLAEKVRASFNRGIFHEEISKLQSDQKEVLSEARLELMAMYRDSNIADALNLDRVSHAKLDELTQDFASLLTNLPAKGSLRYQTLPPAFKGQLDTYIGKILMLTDFAVLERKYLKITDEISELYGNGETTKLHNRESARKKLYTDLGNGVMKVVRNYLDELQSVAPTDRDALHIVIKDNADALIRGNGEYHALLSRMPLLRTPMRTVRDDEQFAALHEKIIDDTYNDVRIRTKLQGYIKARIKQLPPTRPAREGDTVEFINKKGTATVMKVNQDGTLTLKVERKNGEGYNTAATQDDVRVKPEDADGETISGLRDKAEQDAYSAVRAVLDERIFVDSGYRSQLQAQTVTDMLLRLFSTFSQGTNQQKHQRDLVKMRSKDLSVAARRDKKKQQEFGGDWNFEM